MATVPKQVLPVKLPAAPEKYSQEDQDKTRKLIEMALVQISSIITQ